MEHFEEIWWTYEALILSIGINCLLGLSVYIVLSAGQLFLAQAAFMAVGAYTSAVVSLWYEAPFLLAALSGVGMAVVTAFIVSWPMLRLSGIYLAIGTVALGEVVRSVITNSEPLGGALGLSGIPGSAGFLVIYGCAAMALLICLAIHRSKLGRAMEAVREDSTAAAVMGIRPVNYRIGTIILSAAFAGLAGVLNAHSHSSISPADFSFEVSVTILSFALLGGTSSPIGAIVGAAIITMLPEVFRAFATYRGMITGAVIVLIVAFRPDGLVRWRINRMRSYAGA